MPGTPVGANFGGFSNYPALDAAGRRAFLATLQTGDGVTSSNNLGIWSEGSRTLSLVAREGDHAPGTPIGANFGGFSDLTLNASGRTAFSAFLQSGSSGILLSNNDGIWAEDQLGTLKLVVREGDLLEGLSRTFPDGSFNFVPHFYGRRRRAGSRLTTTSRSPFGPASPTAQAAFSPPR